VRTRKHSGIARRSPLTAPQRHLREATSCLTTILPQLDLVHLTSTGVGREIVNAGKLEARECQVFGESLAYFFLARPVYRLPAGDDKSDHIGLFPFGFVCSPENLGHPYHVFPFDSGAAHKGFYNQKLSRSDFLEDFALEPTLDGARKHIEWAFGTNAAYYQGDLRQGLADTIEEWHTVAKGFVRIAGLAASGSNSPDHRAASIEIAYAEHVPLKGNVRLVIMPKQFIENPRTSSKNKELLDRLDELGIQWDVYDWRANETPNFYLDEIARIVQQHLRKQGQL